MALRYRVAFISNTAFMCHVSEDIHYAILPVIGDSPVLGGFRIYDLRTGELLEEDFTDLTEAKKYVEQYDSAA